MSKNCLYCKKEFEKDYRTSKKHFLTITRYCSLKCKRDWMSETFTGSNNPTWKGGQITKSCEVCAKQFKVYPYRKDNVKFCSMKCKGDAMLERFKNKENHYNWRGGITPINIKIRASLEYEEWRTKVYEKDNYTCQYCGEVGGRLEADHIKMFSRYPELRLEVSNGQTLCKDCHRLKTIEDLKVNWKNQFEQSSLIESLN